MRIEPFRAYHVDEMFLRDRDGNGLDSWGASGLRVYERNPGWTGRLDCGTIVLAAGIVIPSKGLGEAWMLTTGLFPKHRLSSFRFIRNVLGSIAQAHGLHRVQAMVAIDHREGKVFMEHLGFGRESTLWCYGPNRESYDLMVWLPK